MDERKWKTQDDAEAYPGFLLGLVQRAETPGDWLWVLLIVALVGATVHWLAMTFPLWVPAVLLPILILVNKYA